MSSVASGSDVKVKPQLRGVPHLFGFFGSLAGWLFLALAPTRGIYYASGIVYGSSLVLMFGLSALYHWPMWSHRVRRVLRRLDHCGIFLLIAGTFTPLAVIHARGAIQLTLWVMWISALLGMVFVVVWSHGPRQLRAGIYVLIGFLAAPVVLTLPARIGTGRVALLVFSSALYLMGAVVYARRWPDPKPAVFGYHEVFHVLVILAAAMQYAVVLDLNWSGALGVG
jgi:hemolysin III